MTRPLRRKLWLALLPVLCCSVFFAAQRSSAQSPAPVLKTGKLIVKISGLRNAEGNIRIAVRTDDKTNIAGQIVNIDPKTLTAEAVFDNLPEGDYGVALFHDENKNAKLDFDESGIPLEGYGHSNNPSKRPGPPDFNETRFNFSAPSATVTVNLIYWP